MLKPNVRLTTFLLLLGMTATAAAAQHATRHPTTTQDDNTSALLGFLLLGGCAFLSGFIASKKGRNPVGWVVAGFIFNILGIVAALIAPAKDRPQTQTPEQEAQLQQLLSAIQSGSFPAMPCPVGVVPLSGEVFFFAQHARHGQTHGERSYSGGGTSYGRKGFRVRNYSGHSKKVIVFNWLSNGTLYLTNKRMVFKVDNSSDCALIPYSKIISYQPKPDGIEFQVSGWGDESTQAFRTGTPALGTLFQKMVEYTTNPQPPPEPQPATIVPSSN